MAEDNRSIGARERLWRVAIIKPAKIVVMPRATDVLVHVTNDTLAKATARGRAPKPFEGDAQ